MGNFIGNFVKSAVSGAVKSVVDIKGSSSRINAMFSALHQYVSVKRELQQTLQQVIGAFISEPSIMIDEDVSSTIPNQVDDRWSDYTKQISKETYDSITDSLNVLIAQGVAAGGYQLSNANGYVFQLCPNSATADGTITGIATTVNPIDESDFIAYEKEGEYYFSWLVKSVGYCRHEEYGDAPTDILALANACLDFTDAPATEYTIDGVVRALYAYEHGTDYQDIDTALDYIMNQHELTPSSDNILCKLDAYYNYLVNQYSGDDYGVVGNFMDVIKDCSNSDTITEVIITASDMLVENRFSIDAFKSQIDTLVASYTASTRVIMNQIIAGYNSGGIYGACMVILHLISEEATIHSTANGTLAFTDDSSLIPQQYIATMVCNILSTVASVAAVILMGISRVASIIVFVVGQVISWIPKALQYDYDNFTLAAIEMGSSFTFNASPTATCQFDLPRSWCTPEIGTSYFMYDEVYSIIKANNQPIYFEVPGGILLVGLTPSDDPEHEVDLIHSSLRCEFHPSFLYGEVANYQYLCGRNEHGLFGFMDYRQYDSYPDYKFKRIYCKGFENITQESIYKAWLSYAQTCEYIDNDSDTTNQTLSVDNDQKVRCAVVRNTCFFYCWLSATFQGAVNQNNLNREGEYMIAIVDGDDPEQPFIISTKPQLNVVSGLFMDYTCFADSWFTWTDITKWFDDHAKDVGTAFGLKMNQPAILPDDVTSVPVRLIEGIQQVILRKSWGGLATPLPSVYNYALKLPKYERSTFWFWVVVSTLVVAATTAITIAVALKIRKFIFKKRAQLTANVENKYEAYKNSMADYNPDDPDDDPSLHTDAARSQAYNDYYKAVRTNNRWANILGGTKYSYAGYWEDTTSSNDVVQPEDESSLSSILNSEYDNNMDEAQAPAKNTAIEDYPTVKEVVELIKGKISSPEDPVR